MAITNQKSAIGIHTKKKKESKYNINDSHQIRRQKNKEERKIKTFKDKSKTSNKGFPGGAVVENLPANAGDTGSSPGLGRSHMPRSN